MIRIVFLFVLICIYLSGVGCDGNSDKKGISVVSTTGMIHDIVLNIAGDRVRSQSLMGPGVDPHLYKATEHDVLALAKADIIFYNGLHLEAKLGDVLSDMAERCVVVAVGNGVDKETLRMPKEFEGFYDPHIWFDVRLWLLAVDSVLQTLLDHDQKNAALYQKNADQYRKQLHALDAYIINQTSLIPPDRRILVTAHDAFGYFGEAYGFEVYALQGISTQSEAAIYDVDQLANFIVMRKVPSIFVESSISKRQVLAVQAAVNAKGWDVAIGGELFSDALGDLNMVEGTYLGMMRHNIHTIVSGLSL